MSPMKCYNICGGNICDFVNESETLEFKTSTNELEEALIDIVAILNKNFPMN